MIVVVDYGMGNLRSVAKALQHVAPDREVRGGRRCRRPSARADRVVLPGQSAMPDCMRGLHRQRARWMTVREVMRDRPFLGICLGLQMLFDDSEEGPTALPGRASRARRALSRRAMILPGGERLKVPHMGWSRVHQTRAHPLWAGIEDGARFYFAHSFHPVPADPARHRGDRGLSGAVYLRHRAG